jgi:hypothetical protein
VDTLVLRPQQLHALDHVKDHKPISQLSALRVGADGAANPAVDARVLCALRRHVASALDAV